MAIRNTINGKSGADTLFGTYDIDVMNGLGGDDSLYGLGGNDTLYGGLGNDQLFGGDDNDRLNGGVGNDWLSGDWGNDVLSGGLGSNFLQGGAGNDTMLAGKGQDVFDGGDDIDTVNFAGHSAIQLIMNDVGSTSLAFSASQPVVSIHGVENVWGSGFGDTIFGDAGDNRILGNGGADTLGGGAGNDYVSGGAGLDVISGGIGSDTLAGGVGNDQFVIDRTDAANANGLSYGQDLITDFRRGDAVVLSGFTFDDPNFTLASRVNVTDSVTGTTVSVHLFEFGAEVGVVDVAFLADTHFASTAAMIAAHALL